MDDARLGGVSAAFLLRPGARAPEAGPFERGVRWCGALFEEVLCVGLAPPPGAPARKVEGGGTSALGGLAAALRQAGGERLLALDATAPGPPDLWLALLAAPPADAVAPGAGEEPGDAPGLPALLRRAPALATAERLLAEGAGALEALAEALGAEHLAAGDAGELGRAELPEAPEPESAGAGGGVPSGRGAPA